MARWQPASISRDMAPLSRRVTSARTAPVTKVRLRRPTVRDAGLPCTLKRNHRRAKAQWDASRPGGRTQRLTFDQMTKLRFAIYLRLQEPVYRRHWQIAREFGVCTGLVDQVAKHGILARDVATRWIG
jgi:hypothetical protein